MLYIHVTLDLDISEPSTAGICGSIITHISHCKYACFLGGVPKFIMGSPKLYDIGDGGSPKLWGPQYFMTPELFFWKKKFW